MESLSTSDMNAVSETTGYEKLQSVFSVRSCSRKSFENLKCTLKFTHTHTHTHSNTGTHDRRLVDAGVSFKDKDAGVEFWSWRRWIYSLWS